MSRQKKPRREVRYESQRKKDDYTYHPRRPFALEWQTDPGSCRLYALDDREAEILRRMLSVFPKYHWIWGVSGPVKDWDAATEATWQEISTFVEELESKLANGCDLQAFIDAQIEQTKAIRELTAVVGSLNLDLTQPVPDNPDYSNSGLAAKFYTNNWLTPDETITDVLANSLMGRYVDFPIPFEGDGIADILDDVLTILHERFVMTDSSIFNPLTNTKNITEALETLLRRDLVTDLEFLTPNLPTILENTLNTGDAGVIPLLKNLVTRIVSELNLPSDVATWLSDQLETTERLSTAQILLMIAAAGGEGGAAIIANAIKEAQTIVNLNNYNGCCDEEDCDCAGAETQTITVGDLCEGELNGNVGV